MTDTQRRAVELEREIRLYFPPRPRVLERFTEAGCFRCQHWVEVEDHQCKVLAKRGTSRCALHPAPKPGKVAR